MPIATLAQVKAKRGIAASDTSRDADLELTLRAAESAVLTATGLSIVVEARTEYHELVREGERIRAQRHPIDTVIGVSADGRDFGSDSDWNELDADVLDPAAGIIRIAGVSLGLGWPPRTAPSMWRISRWRAREWPIVRLVYTTTVAVIPDELSDLTATLGAMWDQAGAGIAQSEKAGDVEVTYRDSSSGDALAIPPIIASRLVPFLPGLVRSTR